jgi:hypothetical protein
MNYLMPTLRRSNADRSAGRQTHLRSLLADAAWAVEDRLVWGAADLLRGLTEAVRWPFERIALAVQHRVVWPIQEETELWGRPARAGALAATLVLAAAGVAAGIVVSDPSGGSQHAVQVSTATGPPAAVAAHPAPKAKGPEAGAVLHGSAPTFAPESGGGIPKSELDSEAAAGNVATEAATGVNAAPTGTGTPAGEGPEVAGPAAIKVARDFSGAFVLYETGHENAEVKATFARTATPDLAKALLERPPRLPANVNVPQAKVLNIVAGPRHGDTYTLSVSLLRVGITSELRIEMQKGKGEDWRVTDVLG